MQTASSVEAVYSGSTPISDGILYMYLSSTTAGSHAHLLEVRVEVVDVDHLGFQRRYCLKIDL